VSEEWRPVVGYEGLYSVSDQGRVRSEGRAMVDKNGRPRKFPAKILKQFVGPINNAGALVRARVMLTRMDSSFATRYVHHLVLAAFVGPCPDGLIGLHWDDDPYNNTLENLRYGTRSDNGTDAVRNGINPVASRNHCARGHEYTPENTAYWSKGLTHRHCRTCSRERGRASAAAARGIVP
jgi:hypothetical protein